VTNPIAAPYPYQGQATEILGSRFRGNDGYAHQAARFLASEGDGYHSSNQMCAYRSAKAGAQACPWQGTGGLPLA
jgi:hypothetical protein